MKSGKNITLYQIVKRMLYMEIIKKEKKLKRLGTLLLKLVLSPFSWLVKLFTNEWEVSIWYDPLKKTVYNFKWIEKCEAKHIKGRLVSGEPFELRTQDAFNYQIRKVK